jgi:hypothetical protein
MTHSSTQTDVVLSIRSIASVGQDEHFLVTVPINGEDTLVPALAGERRVTLSVRVESHNNTDTTWAWQTIERIRTRLGRQSSLDALEAINLALIDAGPAVPVPVVRDRREWSVASMDVALAAAFTDVETDAPFDWIQSVELTASVADIAGTVLPPSINQDATVVGP